MDPVLSNAWAYEWREERRRDVLTVRYTVDEHSGMGGFSDTMTTENLMKAREGQGGLFWLTG